MFQRKSKTYLPPKTAYRVVGNHFETDGVVKNKVTGTMMAGILGCSPWSTPFQVACTLLGLGSEDISGKPQVNVGKILETPLIRYADKTWGQKLGVFLTAEEVFEKRKGDHDAWVSDFDDDTFAGHVDGMVLSESGAEYILEIKTSSNLQSWENGVPEYYYWQVALYNHFIGKQDKAYVVLGMVNEYTYRDPYGFMPCENNVSIFEMDIDDNVVSAKMDEIRKWYSEFIEKGITPDYDPDNPGDVELYEHLCNLTRNIADIRTDVDRLSVVERKIAEHEQTIDDLYSERELLKGSLKEYMMSNKISSVESSDGEYVATMGEQTRSKFDEAAMAADGIDLDKYIVKTTNKTFSIKKSKKRK